MMSAAIGTAANAAGTLDLSVIVVTYNRGPTLLRTLESVLTQSPAAREVIVVDQTQQQPPAVKARLDEWAKLGAIRYVFQAEPNAQRARNHAIAEARCQFAVDTVEAIEAAATAPGSQLSLF